MRMQRELQQAFVNAFFNQVFVGFRVGCMLPISAVSASRRRFQRFQCAQTVQVHYKSLL